MGKSDLLCSDHKKYPSFLKLENPEDGKLSQQFGAVTVDGS
ncbi:MULTISPECIES: hypothetical protein [Corynebacterium]|nr:MULTISPECIES: hypothetical protein [Corynebacterium]